LSNIKDVYRQSITYYIGKIMFVYCLRLFIVSTTNRRMIAIFFTVDISCGIQYALNLSLNIMDMVGITSI